MVNFITMTNAENMMTRTAWIPLKPTKPDRLVPRYDDDAASLARDLKEYFYGFDSKTWFPLKDNFDGWVEPKEEETEWFPLTTVNDENCYVEDMKECIVEVKTLVLLNDDNLAQRMSRKSCFPLTPVQDNFSQLNDTQSSTKDVNQQRTNDYYLYSYNNNQHNQKDGGKRHSQTPVHTDESLVANDLNNNSGKSDKKSLTLHNNFNYDNDQINKMWFPLTPTSDKVDRDYKPVSHAPDYKNQLLQTELENAQLLAKNIDQEEETFQLKTEMKRLKSDMVDMRSENELQQEFVNFSRTLHANSLASLRLGSSYTEQHQEQTFPVRDSKNDLNAPNKLFEDTRTALLGLTKRVQASKRALLQSMNQSSNASLYEQENGTPLNSGFGSNTGSSRTFHNTNSIEQSNFLTSTPRNSISDISFFSRDEDEIGWGITPAVAQSTRSEGNASFGSQDPLVSRLANVKGIISGDIKKIEKVMQRIRKFL